jgi:hypothetical protein
LYTFLAVNTTTRVDEIELAAFVQKAVEINSTLSSLWITGVQIGFRYYDGTGTFAFTDVSLSTSFIPYVLPNNTNNTTIFNTSNTTNRPGFS